MCSCIILAAHLYTNPNAERGTFIKVKVSTISLYARKLKIQNVVDAPLRSLFGQLLFLNNCSTKIWHIESFIKSLTQNTEK